MGSDIQTTIRTNIRAVLADTGTTFTDAILDGAMNEVVADISRITPRELLHLEVLHSRTIIAESFTSNHGTPVVLGNKPIDMQAGITVTNNGATVTYVEYTDYIMNYAEGEITTLSAGSMTDSATHKITYEKSLRGIDLTALTALIGVERVEIAESGGNNYQMYSSWYMRGSILWLQARDSIDTDQDLVENDHVRIWYKAEHTKPGAAASSVPAYLDDVITKGGVAYALFGKSRERNLAAVADLALARTQLLIADDDQAAIDTLETAITAALDSAKTSLALVDAIADTPLGDMETALDAAKASGADASTLIDAAVMDGFNTSIESALDGAAALLDETSSKVVTALGKVVEHLETDSGTPDSAEAQLAAGDTLINATNQGSDAAALYARYAEAQIGISNGFINEATALMGQARGQVEEAQVRIGQKQVYIAEITGELAIADMFISEARGRGEIAIQLTNAALGYIQEAQGRMSQIDRHLQLGQLYINQTRVYQENADRETQSADRFLFDAQERHRDYLIHLNSRVEMAWGNSGAKAALKQNV